MGGFMILNRRSIFAGTFLLVFIGWFVLHYIITGNTNITNTLETLSLFGASLGFAYIASRRFPRSGRNL